jgi:hypothetical protein
MLELGVQPVQEFYTAEAARPAEFLGHLRAPKDPRIVLPLGGAPAESFTHWVTPRGRVTIGEVVRTHMAFYAANPHIVEAGVDQHRERLTEQLAPMWLT